MGIRESLQKFAMLLLIGQVFLVGAVMDSSILPEEPPPEAPAETLLPTAAVASGTTEVKTGTLRESASRSSLPADAGQAASFPQGSTPAGAVSATVSPIPARLRPSVAIVGISQRGGQPFRVLTFDFSGPVAFEKLNTEAAFLRLRVTPGVGMIATATLAQLEKSFRKFSFHRAPGYAEFVIWGKGPLGEPALATSPQGLPRLEIPWQDPGPAFPLSDPDTLAHGLESYRDRPVTKAGPADAFVLRYDPKAAGLQLQPVLANEGICQRERLSAMGRRYEALAGINAAYFTPPRGDPIGTLIISRRLISSPLYDRAVFGLTDGNRPVFGNPDFEGTFTCRGLRRAISSVNGKRNGDSLVVFTPEFGRSTLTDGDGLELVLIRGKVVAIRGSDSIIPPDGIVVSASGEEAAALNAIRLGDPVELEYHVNAPWDRIVHAVCGGPRLITDGRIEITGKAERFDPSIVTGRHPRTAIAETYDGRLLLVVVDGRSKRSAGMTLVELAAYLQRLGARQAMNLDGGGSSTLLADGKVLNRPSDGKERPISNGLLITRM